MSSSTKNRPGQQNTQSFPQKLPSLNAIKSDQNFSTPPLITSNSNMNFQSRSISEISIGLMQQKAQNLVEQDLRTSEKQCINACYVISFAVLVIITGSFIAEDMQNQSIHFKFTIPFMMFSIMMVFIKLFKTNKNFVNYFPICMNLVGAILLTEKQIVKDPENYSFSDPMIGFLSAINYFNTIIYINWQRQLVNQFIGWTYYIARSYHNYGYWSTDFVFAIILSITFSILSARAKQQQQEKIISLYQTQNRLMEEKWEKTLNIIPEGVAIIDSQSKLLTYYNPELKSMFGLLRKSNESIKDQIQQLFSQYKMQDIQEIKVDNSNKLDQTLNSQRNYTKQENNGVKNSLSNDKLFETPNNNCALSGLKSPKLITNLFTNNDNSGKNTPQAFINNNTNMTFNEKSSAFMESNQKQSLWSFIQSFQSLPDEWKSNKNYVFKKRGEFKFLLIKVQFINQEDNQMIVIVNDITRIKELEQYNQKVRALFFSSVAHELRTPLNSIIPMSENLKTFVKSKAGLEILQIIINSAVHLSMVIEDALDMSRLENNKFEVNISQFKLEKTMKNVIDILKFQSDLKGIQLTYEIDPELTDTISTDEKRYKQVLFNLVGNALKFTLKGSISVKVKLMGVDMIKTIVKDTGIGIPQDQMSKLFSYFGKLSQGNSMNKGGLGLGLSISKMIVQQLGGQITVKSQEGVGSSFKFTIKMEQHDLSQVSRVNAARFELYDSDQIEIEFFKSNNVSFTGEQDKTLQDNSIDLWQQPENDSEILETKREDWLSLTNNHTKTFVKLAKNNKFSSNNNFNSQKEASLNLEEFREIGKMISKSTITHPDECSPSISQNMHLYNSSVRQSIKTVENKFKQLNLEQSSFNNKQNVSNLVKNQDNLNQIDINLSKFNNNNNVSKNTPSIVTNNSQVNNNSINQTKNLKASQAMGRLIKCDSIIKNHEKMPNIQQDIIPRENKLNQNSVFPTEQIVIQNVTFSNLARVESLKNQQVVQQEHIIHNSVNNIQLVDIVQNQNIQQNLFLINQHQQNNCIALAPQTPTKNQQLLARKNSSHKLLEQLKKDKFQILIVDDQIYNLIVLEMLLKQVLSEKVMEITKAQNGREALDKMLERHSKLPSSSTTKNSMNYGQLNLKPFDIVFLDIQMPIMDGIQTIKEIMKQQALGNLNIRNTKIYALTAQSKSEFKNQHGEQNFDDYMEKPISIEALKKILKNDLMRSIDK
eukprot:403356194